MEPESVLEFTVIQVVSIEKTRDERQVPGDKTIVWRKPVFPGLHIEEDDRCGDADDKHGVPGHKRDAAVLDIEI